MKVKELNALLGKLAKKNQDAEVYLGFPTLIGPQFDQPAVVEAKDGLYIVPQQIESRIETTSGKEAVGQRVMDAHANWQQQEDNTDRSQAG